MCRGNTISYIEKRSVTATVRRKPTGRATEEVSPHIFDSVIPPSDVVNDGPAEEDVMSIVGPSRISLFLNKLSPCLLVKRIVSISFLGKKRDDSRFSMSTVSIYNSFLVTIYKLSIETPSGPNIINGQSYHIYEGGTYSSSNGLTRFYECYVRKLRSTRAVSEIWR